MNLDELFELIKQNFPYVIEPTYQEIYRIYGYKRHDTDSFRFIEILANILNDEINEPRLKIDFDKFFGIIEKAYLIGNEETKERIDVGLVENLFWNVSKDKSQIYWQKLPPILQNLYINFHGIKPYID